MEGAGGAEPSCPSGSPCIKSRQEGKRHCRFPSCRLLLFRLGRISQRFARIWSTIHPAWNSVMLLAPRSAFSSRSGSVVTKPDSP